MGPLGYGVCSVGSCLPALRLLHAEDLSLPKDYEGRPISGRALRAAAAALGARGPESPRAVSARRAAAPERHPRFHQAPLQDRRISGHRSQLGSLLRMAWSWCSGRWNSGSWDRWRYAARSACRPAKDNWRTPRAWNWEHRSTTRTSQGAVKGIRDLHAAQRAVSGRDPAQNRPRERAPTGLADL